METKGFINEIINLFKVQKEFLDVENWFSLIPDQSSFPEEWILSVASKNEKDIILRFFVKNKKTNQEVSVMLAFFHSNFSISQPPRWEVWSYDKSREYRCNLEKIEQLIENIKSAFDMSLADYDDHPDNQ